MKILIVSDYAAPRGGVETLIRDLRDELRDRNHEVRVFSTDIGQDADGYFADYQCDGSEGPRRTLLQTWNRSAAPALHKALHDFQPDIVHVRMFLTQLSPAILPILRDWPALYHLAWYRAICPTGLKHLPDGRACRTKPGVPCLRHGCLPVQDWALRLIQLALARKWLSTFRAVVANSQAVASQMAQAGIATEVISNGIRVPRLDSDPASGLADHPTVMFAGRLTPEKGCAQLLAAFRIVADDRPGAKLLIAGDGIARASLEALTEELRLSGQVQFLGHLPPGALQRHLRSAWLQVVPSLWEEPFGIAALDGMMQARPVIASPSGGLAEIVQHGTTGLLINPLDAQAMADGILGLLRDRDHARRLGNNGRELAARRFSIARCADDFTALYSRLQARS